MIPVELLYGILVSMVNIVLHCLVIVVLVRVMLGLRPAPGSDRLKRRHTLIFAGLMMVAGAVLTFSHMLQVWIWAISYWLVDAMPAENTYYFAFESFTTVGYGDIVPVRRWRVLGPITAANGMLLFGASTALIFAILTQAASVLDVFEPMRHRRGAKPKAAKSAPPETSPER